MRFAGYLKHSNSLLVTEQGYSVLVLLELRTHQSYSTNDLSTQVVKPIP